MVVAERAGRFRGRPVGGGLSPSRGMRTILRHADGVKREDFDVGPFARSRAPRSAAGCREVPSMPRVILGSASPRRRRLLEDDGWEVVQRPPRIDDGEVDLPSSDPRSTVLALAWFKAAQMPAPNHECIAAIAADTVCVLEDRILGKPGDLAQARAMLQGLLGGRHRTLTGVCVTGRGRDRRLLVDGATVEMGPVSESELEAYLQTGEWRDKAGGYNLADRIAAGWPIRCIGDPTTVMGLPMARLGPLLRRLERRTVGEDGP